MVLRALPEVKVTQASSLTRPAGIFLLKGTCRLGSLRDGTARMAVLRAATRSAQHFQQCERVFRRGAFGVIVEVDVHIAVFL